MTTTASPTNSSPDVTPREEIARITTTTAPSDPYPNIAPPLGGFAGDWGDEKPWRIIYGQRHEVGTYVTGAWACQQSDGTVRGNDGHDVYVDKMDEHGEQCEKLNLSAAEARELAKALLAAADDIDGWLSK